MLLISFVYVALMGYSRMIAGAHYLTDVVGGAIIGYTLFLIVYKIYNTFCNKSILPTRK
jgi:membrane-associated phospholipid phosphatase